MGLEKGGSKLEKCRQDRLNDISDVLEFCKQLILSVAKYLLVISVLCSEE